MATSTFGQLRSTSTTRPFALANWLLAVAALVFAMVVVGGITRLTESGLSITEWRPISGAIPPLTDAQWQAAFDLYKATPEYREVNAGMSMAAFKFIFFWEYIHRLLGRVIGLAFALPLLWFWIRGAIPTGYHPRLLALLALGALQGTVGWWMVVSGLSERVDVSHYRLAVHLLAALFILAGLVWTALVLRALARDPGARPARLTAITVVVGGVLFIQLLLGAYVAGMNAGHVTSQWPLMNDRLVPDGIDWALGAAAFADDPFLVHFVHRWWAFVTLAAVAILALRVKRAGGRGASIAMHATIGVQLLLGIATVMSGVGFLLAVLHQAVGALVVAASAWGAHRLGSRNG